MACRHKAGHRRLPRSPSQCPCACRDPISLMKPKPYMRAPKQTGVGPLWRIALSLAKVIGFVVALPWPPWTLIWAILWFGLAASMAIWPHVLGAPDSTAPHCVLEYEDDLLSCFISQAWGTPSGIATSLLCGLATLWYFLKSRVPHRPITPRAQPPSSASSRKEE